MFMEYVIRLLHWEFEKSALTLLCFIWFIFTFSVASIIIVKFPQQHFPSSYYAFLISFTSICYQNLASDLWT